MRGAPAFRLVVDAPGTPDEVWARLWDLDRHTAAIPLTRVSIHDAAVLHHASRFTAHTRLGPFTLDDQMVVRCWDPPCRATIDKVGAPLVGTITVTLAPHGARTQLVWHQSVRINHIPDALVRLAIPALALGYRVALGRILRLAGD